MGQLQQGSNNVGLRFDTAQSERHYLPPRSIVNQYLLSSEFPEKKIWYITSDLPFKIP